MPTHAPFFPWLPSPNSLTQLTHARILLFDLYITSTSGGSPMQCKTQRALIGTDGLWGVIGCVQAGSYKVAKGSSAKHRGQRGAALGQGKARGMVWMLNKHGKEQGGLPLRWGCNSKGGRGQEGACCGRAVLGAGCCEAV